MALPLAWRFVRILDFLASLQAFRRDIWPDRPSEGHGSFAGGHGWPAISGLISRRKNMDIAGHGGVAR